MELTAKKVLPEDSERAVLVGRVWRPEAEGPSVVVLREGHLHDVSAAAPTIAELLNAPDPVALLRATRGESLGLAEAIIANSAVGRRKAPLPWLLAPADLQPIKACGVTFVESLLERVIEERAKGDPSAAQSLRESINAEIGGELAAVKPGSAEAERLKTALQQRGLWSPYLEVGIGPDAEVFTKAPPLAAVGCGDEVGLHPRSQWNNPEPEVVLAISARGRIVGATLGNDVNLRDFEGRSALLLGKAKDNNASCALGPFIRILEESFTLEDLRRLEVTLSVTGADGFTLAARSSLARISRDVEDLAAETLSETHQYPDGVLLFTGTMFAPTKDRDTAGQGFTHKEGDLVTIASPRLGALTNRVTRSDRAAPWTFGLSALMRNLAARGLLPTPPVSEA